jgi:hypothetical protein
VVYFAIIGSQKIMSLGEIQADLEKIKGHVESHTASVNEGTERAHEAYTKLRAVHGHLLKAIGLAREAGVDYKAGADIIKAGADEHLTGIREAAARIGLENMGQEAARTLAAAIGDLTLQSDSTMFNYRRGNGLTNIDSEGRTAFNQVLHNALTDADNVEQQYTDGAWAASEYKEAADIALRAIGDIVL